MDILTIAILILGFLGFFALLGIPIPYGVIGKKTKKGLKLTKGVMDIVVEKFFVSNDVVEHFNYYIEEFENFTRSDSIHSFPSLYAEITSRAKLSDMERKHVSNETERVDKEYTEIESVEKLNKKKIFKETVKKFHNLVVRISKMAKSIEMVIKKETLDYGPAIEAKEAFAKRYNFTAKEFNIYLRHFRSFLDRTYCYHNVEIKHNRLRNLLVPEEISFQEKRVKV